ncbi:MAG: Acyl-CoA dehydrogenase C-terminal domain-containing protein [Bacteroidales bacterium]|nr:Acyl-CoA dehydrogenase C-terminal domain-containing protein [Bacteroidales bacterium]MDY3912712.1 acyl-CoA dehydrogenase family protein [Sodaliphilus sp.]
MANFYNDNKALQYYLNHPLMKKIVTLRERNFTECEKYDYAPFSFEDAMDSYEKVLEIAGEISGDIVAPNAKDVDLEGPHHENGRVRYASGTEANLKALVQAGLMGISLPRQYGGLNFSLVPYIMAADLVSRADASFVNIWGLQDCAETICEFASEDQRQRFLPRVCAGETMAMDLTEPDAGSDLQSVMLKATEAEDGTWRLNGVKRFITNGDGDIALVLARSEAGSHDGRGLSMFIFDKRDGGVTVRRIEDKMGIHGSPTCELVFKNAKAELCGSRRLGLIKYVMSLMNGARLGIAAQSVGVSESAYREADAYARSREQFGQPIINFPAVAELVANIKAKLDASRTILYECTRFVDVYKTYDAISRERTLTPEERAERKHYNRLADAFTPLAKGMTSEFANQNAYDCVQVHGGSGFMRDYACERIYRDARITSIYEGTTQLQVVAAIRHVTTGTYSAQMKEYAAGTYSDEMLPLKAKLDKMIETYEKAVETVKAVGDTEYVNFQARRLVEMAGHIIMGYLLIYDATNKPELFSKSAHVYVNYGEAQVAANAKFIAEFQPADFANYKQD